MIHQKDNIRTYKLGNIADEKEISAKFPCTEEEIQRICDKLEVKNQAATTIQVVAVDHPELNKSIAGSQLTLDELNFLESRLHGFSENEVKLFCAISEVDAPKNGYDLINISYNLNSFSLVDNSRNMEEMGKELYLHERISCSTEELQQINGQKYLADLMKYNIPMETSAGLLYFNKNPLVEEYNGTTFPRMPHKNSVFEVKLMNFQEDTVVCEENFHLPYVESALLKCVQRMGGENLADITVADVSVLFGNEEILLDRLNFSEVKTGENLHDLNCVAKFCQNNKLSDVLTHSSIGLELEITTISEFLALIPAMQEDQVELALDIFSPEEYGEHQVRWHENLIIPDNLAEFIDFEAYGNTILEDKHFAFSNGGMVVYSGDSAEVVELLNNLNQGQEQAGMTDLT